VNVRAVAFCALIMVASPAAAEPWGPYGPGGYPPGPVPLYGIQATLRANGLHPIRPPVFSGPYVVVRAVDSSGEMVRVLLSARSGTIVSVVPLPPAPVVGYRGYYGAYPYPYRPYEAYPYPPAEPYPRYSSARPDLKVEPAPPEAPNGQYPVPNGQPGAPGQYGGPNGQSAALNPQDRRSAAPARTPMPRPRPPIPEATAAAKPAPAPEAPHAAPAPTAAAPTAGAAPSRGGAQSFPPPAALE